MLDVAAWPENNKMRAIRAGVPDSQRRLDTVQFGHDHIADDDIRTKLLCQLNGLTSTESKDTVVTGAGEDVAKALRDRFFVIYDEYADLARYIAASLRRVRSRFPVCLPTPQRTKAVPVRSDPPVVIDLCSSTMLLSSLSNSAQRELNGKGGSLERLAAKSDTTAMLLNQTLRHPQPKSSSYVGLGCEERS